MTSFVLGVVAGSLITLLAVVCVAHFFTKFLRAILAYFYSRIIRDLDVVAAQFETEDVVDGDVEKEQEQEEEEPVGNVV